MGEWGRPTTLAVVDRAGFAVAPPLLFGSGQEDLIELCQNTPKSVLLRSLPVAPSNHSRTLIQQGEAPPVATRGQCSFTCCDVELVANGETPDSPPDAGRKSLPPQLPDTPRSLPAHEHTQINTLMQP